MGEVIKKDVPIVAPEFRLSRSASTRVPHRGLRPVEMAMATYDVTGGDSGSIAAHNLGVFIPKNAIVTRVWVDVITTFTSSTDAATMAISLQSANDAVSALAISDATNIWDAGMHGSKIGFPNFGADAAHDSAVEVAALFAGTFLKLTAEREIVVTNAVEIVTAGKMNIFVEYFLSA